MLWAPIMTKLMSSDQVSLTGDDTLPIVIPGGAKAGIQVQGVTVLEVLWK